MSDQTVRKFMRDFSEVATLPEVSMRIMQMMEDPDTEAKDLQDIFREDPALSSKLLKLANSPFYGFSRQVADVGRAIVLLGFNAVKALALSSSVGSMFAADTQGEAFSPGQLWTHSLAVGVTARRAFRLTSRPEGEAAFLAGVMHDLGLLLEHQCKPQPLAEAVESARSSGGSLLDAEQALLDTDHCELGRAVAEAWHFPAMLASAMGYHHSPSEAPEDYRGLAHALALGDVLSAQLDIGFAEVHPSEEVSARECEAVGLDQAQFDGLRDSVAEEVNTVRAVMGV